MPGFRYLYNLFYNILNIGVTLWDFLNQDVLYIEQFDLHINVIGMLGTFGASALVVGLIVRLIRTFGGN